MPDTKPMTLEEILKEFEHRRAELLEELDVVEAALRHAQHRYRNYETLRAKALPMWELYKEGYSLKEVAAEFKVSYQYVRTCLVSAGYRIRSREEGMRVKSQRSKKELLQIEAVYGEPIRKLYESRQSSIDKIAEELNISPGLVKKLIHHMYSPEERKQIRRELKHAWLDREFSDEDLLEQLRQCAADIGRTPGGRAFNIWAGTQRAQLVIMRFNTWADACKAAGLEPNVRYNYKNWGVAKYSEEACTQAFRRVQSLVGHPPTVAEYEALRTEQEPSVSTLRKRHNNSWRKAQKAYKYREENDA